MQRSVSIVIPAHNEAKYLPACLESVFCQSFDGLLDVAVIANGCTDQTVAVAKAWMPEAAQRGHQLRIESIPESSKAAALNLGDLVTVEGIKVYLDADVCISPNTIEAVADRLHEGSTVHLCAPALRIAPTQSQFTRSFARVWRNFPHVRNGLFGRGFYAVSAAGRRRWNRFPHILSEDEFVFRRFFPHECATIETASVTIRLPEGLRELVRIRSRCWRGKRQLVDIEPGLARSYRGRFPSAIQSIGSDPAIWLDVPAYMLIYVLARLKGCLDLRSGTALWQQTGK